jgi:hypothetical protein
MFSHLHPWTAQVYMSEADSGSTTVSHIPESSLTEIRALVVSITATNTVVRPETEVKTVTDSAAPPLKQLRPTKLQTQPRLRIEVLWRPPRLVQLPV